MKHKDKNKQLLLLTKETPEARKQRLACGNKYRPAVFEDKRKKAQNRKPDVSQDLSES